MSASSDKEKICSTACIRTTKCDKFRSVGTGQGRLTGSWLPSFPGPLGDSAPAQNPYKMRTKCDHFRECELFIRSAAATYNFDTLKCTHFLVGSPHRRRPQARPAHSFAAISVTSVLTCWIPGRHRKLTKTTVSDRKRLWLLYGTE